MKPELIRELPLSAASGLVLFQDYLYLVSDDELYLYIISEKGRGEVQRIPLLEGELPEEHDQRKKAKPDFESLVRDGQNLYVIPSGSKSNRNILVHVQLNERGEFLSSHSIKLAEAYQELSRNIADLNIEGALIIQGVLYLFQRGNGASGKNAVISLSLTDLLNDKVSDLKVSEIDLGEIDGTAYTFTDACLRSSTTAIFLATAEASESTYLDGEIKGAIFGELNLRTLEWSSTVLEMKSKPEGIDIDPTSGIIYLCTDDDDRSIPSKLYHLHH